VNENGRLYLCATPIGNLGDITYRAVETLRTADLIAAEDTRHTRGLLAHYDIHTPMTSYHEHNKDSKGNRSNDKQGEKTRGNSTETTGNPKDNSKKENTDPNREKRVELGKTIGIETFKFGGDLPVTLLNKQADSLAKEYRSLQKEIPAYVVKQGRLTKVGVLSPLGLIYDTYQDAQKYNGGKFVGAVAINTGAFVGTILLDSALTSTGVGAIGVIPTNVFVAEGTTWLKEKVLDEPKVEEKH